MEQSKKNMTLLRKYYCVDLNQISYFHVTFKSITQCNKNNYLK